MQDRQVQDGSTAYLIGGGIASLAAAAFLIRDANFKGHNIVVLEELAQLGGVPVPSEEKDISGAPLREENVLCFEVNHFSSENRRVTRT